MNNPISFYKHHAQINTEKSKALYKRLTMLSLLRLTVFLSTIIAIYITHDNVQVASGIAIVGIVIFLVLLSKYVDIKKKRELHKRLVDINEDELNIANGDFHDRDDGIEFQDPKHFYSLDIDLFGKGSFFQYINRTTIKEGKQSLAKLLLDNNIEGIQQRQEAIKELSLQPIWRQYYTAFSKGVKVQYSAHAIMNWIKNYKPFLGRFVYYLSFGFSMATVVVVVFSFFKVISFSIVGYWLFLGLGISAVHLKKINHLSAKASQVKDTFRQYALLLKEIETIDFSSELLKSQQQKIKTSEKTASQIFTKFSKLLESLDNRNNIFFAILGNGFFLTDLRQAFRIEQWILSYAQKLEDWFEAVTFFDAYNSLGNFSFNHPEFTFPDIVNSTTTITAKDLGHPLLQSQKRVSSDVNISKTEFFIVTGANMAGKSTFLRTVGLYIVMANSGLPVCAKNSQYTPIKLITSMRTTDSLTDDSSYFFSELTRLKFVVDTIENNDSYFIILDEILKGTNSTDKAIGSRKFVEKLVKQNATGIIATHDLSLTEIESHLETVNNYFFDAEIKNDELFFDYKLKKGVCQNMNASFLLKKMDIV